MHDLQHLRVFCFLFSSFTESGRGWGKGHRRESKHKEETPGIFSQVKIIPLELFLTLFFIFFPLLDVKITKKNLSRKQKPQYIYYIHLAAAPVYLQKCCFLSTCTNYFNTWSFFLSSDSCIENSWRTKVDFRRGLSYLIFLHFSKNWHISNQRGKDWYLFLYIYIYICNVFLKQH